MARPSDGPRCPQAGELDSLVDYLNELQMDDKTRNRLVEILDWANEQVNKRRYYSKKFQLKDKARTALLKEKLGEDYDNIVAQATRSAGKQISEEVANGEPDNDIDELVQQQHSTDEE